MVADRRRGWMVFLGILSRPRISLLFWIWARIYGWTSALTMICIITGLKLSVPWGKQSSLLRRNLNFSWSCRWLPWFPMRLIFQNFFAWNGCLFVFVPHCHQNTDVQRQISDDIFESNTGYGVLIFKSCRNKRSFQSWRIFNNYSPKWRWLVVDIYRAAKRRGKYPTLATDTEVNSCFSIY